MYSLFPSLKKHRGFSLIEMAIVLMILGLIGSASLSFLGHLCKTKPIKETQKKQKILMAILAQHKKQYGYLPCPTIPGTKGKNKASCPGATLGIVPYGELGLGKEDAMDAYHRYFTYGIVSRETNQPRGPRNAPSPKLTKQFEIVAFSSTNPVPETRTADVILLSHGKNGHGAYLENGEKLCSLEIVGRHEHMNANDSLTFVDHPTSFTDHTYHDDQLLAETQDTIEIKYAIL